MKKRNRHRTKERADNSNPTHFKTKEKPKVDWKTIRHIIFWVILSLFLFSIYSYLYQSRRDNIIDSSPAYTNGYVDKATVQRCSSPGYIEYHFYVDGVKFNNHCGNPVATTKFMKIFNYGGKNAHIGDSVRIKYCKTDPSYSVVIDIIEN